MTAFVSREFAINKKLELLITIHITWGEKKTKKPDEEMYTNDEDSLTFIGVSCRTDTLEPSGRFTADTPSVTSHA